MIGVIKSLREDKKFGFIRVNGQKNDYFFHRDDYQEDWDTLVVLYNQGDVKVNFEGIGTPKGPRASNVTLA
jgi:cold shock CspA family protein